MTQPLTAIPLGRDLRHGSSHLPASSASRLNACLFGVAPGGGCRVSPRLPALANKTNGLVSVALFLAFTANLRPRLITDGCYPPPCSMEPGLSSMHGTNVLRHWVLPTHSGCLANFADDGSTREGSVRASFSPRSPRYCKRHNTSPPARNGVKRSSP
jgi:hypothetical protein